MAALREGRGCRAFFDLCPEIEVQAIAEAQLLDLRAERIDLATRFGGGEYPRHSVSRRMTGQVLPVCSSQLLAEQGPISTIEELPGVAADP